MKEAIRELWVSVWYIPLQLIMLALAIVMMVTFGPAATERTLRHMYAALTGIR